MCYGLQSDDSDTEIHKKVTLKPESHKALREAEMDPDGIDLDALFADLLSPAQIGGATNRQRRPVRAR